MAFEIDPPELILASTSPYRRSLLERLGIPFRCQDPCVDEDFFKSRIHDPLELAEQLAEAKATSLCDREPRSTLIGGDQLVVFEGLILGKPGAIPRAIEQLEAMSGRSHELITALAVWSRGRVVRHTDVTRLRMRRLGREEIARVVEADRPIDCAGSYKLEGRGIMLFDSIESADHTAVTGLPLIALTSILRDLGHAVP